jgi:hydroxyquinol 1,2-dioxygenase
MENAMPYITEANLTDIAVERWQNVPDPRLRRVMTSMIRHLHAFVREIEPTEKEWFTAIDWLTRVGKMSDEKRQEFILASDVLAVSMLVDAINHRLATGATPSTVEGPFHIGNSPELADGESMADGAPGIPCFVSGKVTDLDGKPVGGVVLDIWQTDGEGLYEAQRPGADRYMRAVYRTRPDGSYVVRTVAPVGYTIPMDGPVGALMKRTNISVHRPAHIHFCLEAPGYHRIVTHLFQEGDRYIDTDVVYGVKEPLITGFVRQPAGARAPTGETINEPFYEVRYDFVLQKATKAQAA